MNKSHFVNREVFIPAFFSGIVNQTVGYPFLNITTRRSVHHSEKYPSAIQCAITTFKEEGIFGLYKGALFPFLATGIISSLSFSSYHYIRDRLIQKQSEIILSQSESNDATTPHLYRINLVSGCITGLLASFLYAPIDLIRTRLMLQYTESQRTGSLIELKNMYRSQHPIRSIYRILPISFIHQAVGTAFYYSSHDLVDNIIRRKEENDSLFGDVLSFFRRKEFSALSGVVGGVFAGIGYWLAAMPFFSIQTRQSYDAAKYPTIGSTARFIYSNFGLSGFYKGLSPAIIRAIPTHAMVFLTFDFLNAYFPKRGE